MCGVDGERGVDWRFVRMSSRGEAIVDKIDRERIPDRRGVRTGEGERGGRVVFRR